MKWQSSLWVTVHCKTLSLSLHRERRFPKPSQTPWVSDPCWQRPGRWRSGQSVHLWPALCGRWTPSAPATVCTGTPWKTSTACFTFMSTTGGLCVCHFIRSATIYFTCKNYFGCRHSMWTKMKGFTVVKKAISMEFTESLVQRLARCICFTTGHQHHWTMNQSMVDLPHICSCNCQVGTTLVKAQRFHLHACKMPDM